MRRFLWLDRLRWRWQIRGKCPKGGRHAWDILTHGPAGSVFECMKCKKELP